VSNVKLFCWMFCTVMIFLGVALSLAMVWGGVDSDVAWKGIATIVILFFGAGAVGAVAEYLGKERK